MLNSKEKMMPHLHAVAWETTRKCPLNCIHCRAAAANSQPEDELSTEEGFRLIDGIANFAKPMLILTGGEPMTRPDIYDLASYATAKGLRVVMAPCGHLLTAESLEKIKSSGIKALSISLDGANASTHDAFRGSPGAFEKSLAGIRCAKEAHMHFQINTTVSRLNVHQLPQILDLAESIGASAVDFFFLVPTGRGKELDAELLPTHEYEKTLLWIAEERSRRKIRVKTTCAPHFARISRTVDDGSSPEGGCLAGGGFVFVSHRGIMQPCGFLDIPCGDLRKMDFDFGKIYMESEVFRSLRDPDRYDGKCSVCEFRMLCGGCRARAYAGSGDILSADPTCSHVPRVPGNSVEIGELTRNELLLRLQKGIPLERRPFYTMAGELGLNENQVISFIMNSFSQGEARRVGGIFDGRKMGYKNTLCAASPLPDREADFIRYIRSLPGVTHCYERGWPEELKKGIPGSPDDENYLKLWFTFGAPAETFKSEFGKIEEMNCGGVLLNLPALKMFKTDVIFDLKQLKENGPKHGNSEAHKSANHENRVFTENEKAAIRLLQGNLTVKRDFYAEPASRLGISVDELLEMLRNWQDCGIMKRIGLLLNHLSIGFKANGMCVWKVSEEMIEEKGRILAGYPAITHCYQRVMDDRFPFNLYAMTHAGNWKDLYSVFSSISKENSLEGGQLFCSIKEIKKTSMNYFI
ncbi:MAG: radical SAM protein [Victivallales bacterium]|jgi:radical SAM protein with 4Fe4S-binding SPASM domain